MSTADRLAAVRMELEMGQAAYRYACNSGDETLRLQALQALYILEKGLSHEDRVALAAAEEEA